MTQIKITAANRNPNGYIELTYFMRFVLPTIYGTTQVPIVGLQTILNSYPDGFILETTTDSPALTFIDYSKTVSFPSSVTLAQIKTGLQGVYTTIRAKLDSLTLTPYDTISGLSYDGTNWS